MTTLVEEIRSALAAAADAGRAPAMQAYMKSAMPFRGIPRPVLRRTLRPLLTGLRIESARELEETVRELYLPAAYREERYAALELLAGRAGRPFRGPDRVPLLRELITVGAWWDLVDEVAGHYLADLHRADPDRLRPVLLEWSGDPDLWLRRSSIIAQLGSRDATDTEVLTVVIDRNAADREFFIRKAIGWALREYARTDPDWVRRFVAEREETLSPLSKREARKHL